MGLFNGICDGVKFVLKEDFRPPFVDKLIYNIAPFFAVIPPLVTFSVVPFGGPFAPGEFFSVWYLSWIPVLPGLLSDTFGSGVYQMQVADLNIGLLFVFAMGGIGVFASALAGWSSNSKYALLGGIRASAQMISYEIALGVSLLGILLIYGTVDLRRMVEIQGNFWMWGAILQPHMMFIFLASSMAENKRIPFDLPEGESELVAGYFMEYSGMKLGLFMSLQEEVFGDQYATYLDASAKLDAAIQPTLMLAANASTLGVCRKSRPKISSLSAHC